MACNSCGSANQHQFLSEMVIHLPGLKNLTKPTVFAFPKLQICVECGFTELVLAESVLRLLGSDAIPPRLQTSSTQEMIAGGVTS
jgi:hypothetical protein